MPRKPVRKRVRFGDLDHRVNAKKISEAIKGVNLPARSRGGNRKARQGKRPDLRYHAEPTPEAFWRWILIGDVSGLIRPLPGGFPPDVPMKDYMRDLESLVSRLAEQKQGMGDALLFHNVRRLVAYGDKDRRIAKALRVPKMRYRIRRMADKARLLAAAREYLARTLPQRVKAHRGAPHRPTRAQ